MASSWTPEGGEVTQSPGRVGAAEKLCEKRKSIEKFMREENFTTKGSRKRKSIAQWQARPSKLPWVGREGASFCFAITSNRLCGVVMPVSLAENWERPIAPRHSKGRSHEVSHRRRACCVALNYHGEARS